MGRLFGFAAIALALLFAGGPAGRPLELPGPQRQAKTLVGLVASEDGARLTHLGETLRAVGPRSKNVGFVDAWALSPDAGIAAVAAHRNSRSLADTLRFVELRGLRLVHGTVNLGAPASLLYWPTPHRILALVGDCCSSETTLVVVDPGTRSVVSHATLAGTISSVAHAGTSLVLLSTPANTIGPATLIVVDARGGVSGIELERVRAGRSWPQDMTASPIGTQRIPALAVDPDGRRAYVVQPDGPAAEVSLESFEVSYHDLGASSLGARLSKWLTPAAEAKGMNGVAWKGVWLGNGFMAVTGEEEHATLDANNRETMSGTPAGLALVDVRSWTIRTLDPGAADVAIADNLLLATGSTWSSDSRTQTGMGLAAYGPDTAQRFRLFGGEAAWVEAIWEGRAYVQVGSTTNVVELASGRVVERRTGELPVPLLPAL